MQRCVVGEISESFMFGNLFIQPLYLIDNWAGHWILGFKSNSLKILQAAILCSMSIFPLKTLITLILIALWRPWPSVEAFRVLPVYLVTYYFSVVPRHGPCFRHCSGLMSSTSEKFPCTISLIISSPLFFLCFPLRPTPQKFLIRSMCLIYWFIFFPSLCLDIFKSLTSIFKL